MPDTFHNLNSLLNSHHKKIGLFDSGIGGVSILNELTKLPIETFVYVADTAHLPYGTKSPEFLLERAIIITRYLQTHGINTIIVACHTSAATTLPNLKKLFPDITFINPLPLTTYAALLETKTNHVGVLATPTSIQSGVHKKLLLGQNLEPLKELSIIEQACPLFVDLIENSGTTLAIKQAIETYTKNIGTTIVDTLILGCTHYPFIADQIQQALPHTKLISAASCIAEKLKDIPTPLTRGIVIFKTSGTPEKTEVLLEKFFNKKSVSSYAVTQLETLYR